MAEKKKREVVHREKEIQEVSIKFAENVLFICRTNPDRKISGVESAVGFKPGYIAQYASGHFQRGLPIDKACQIADYLGENVYDLMTKNYRLEDAVKWQREHDRSVDEIKRELGI